MRWGPVIGTIIITLLIFLFQWPKFKNDQKKEKVAFLSILLLALFLINLLYIFPELPGPTELSNSIYKPFGKLLE